MKLAPRTFVVEWAVHAWVSVFASVLLFTVSFTGVFALFVDDLAVWEEPDMARVAPGPLTSAELDRVLPALARHGALLPGSRVRVHLHDERPFVSALVQDPATRAMTSYRVERTSGRVLPERTRLALELFFLHFLYRLPYGMQLAGAAAIALLVALVSGVAIHLKDLWRQRWQFRPPRPARVLTSDLHKVLGVFGLPFALVMAWSGAFLGLGTSFAAGLASTQYQGDLQKVYALHGMVAPAQKASGASAPSLSLSELTTKAQALEPSRQLEAVDVKLYGDRNAWARLSFTSKPFEAKPFVQLDMRTGQLLGQSAAQRTPSRAFADTMFALHFGHFGGYLLKALYVVLGLALCAVTISGNLIWITRRDPRALRRSTRVLSRLTAGTSAGLVLATAFSFVENRALPASLPQRADLEAGLFFALWAACGALAFVPTFPALRSSAVMLALASAGYAAVVLSNVSRSESAHEATLVVSVLLTALAACAGALALPLWTLPRKAAVVSVHRNEELIHADQRPTQS